MIIEYTDTEIAGSKLAAGNYDFIITNAEPVTSEYNGVETTKLNLTLDANTPDGGVQVYYAITVQSTNEQYQKIGRDILKRFAMAMFPSDWKLKLAKLDTDDLLNHVFNADINYKDDKYLQFHKIKSKVKLNNLYQDDSNRCVPF